jgi:hypothetical protein
MIGAAGCGAHRELLRVYLKLGRLRENDGQRLGPVRAAPGERCRAESLDLCEARDEGDGSLVKLKV